MHLSTDIGVLEVYIHHVREARAQIAHIKPKPGVHIFIVAMLAMIAEVLAVVLGYVPLVHGDRGITAEALLIVHALVGTLVMIAPGVRKHWRKGLIETFDEVFMGKESLTLPWMTPAHALFAPLICAIAWISVRLNWASTEAENQRFVDISRDPRADILLSLDESLNRFSALEANYLDDAARAKAGLLAAEEFAAKDREHWVRVRELQVLGKELNDSFRARPLGTLKPLLLTTDSETRREQASDYTASLDELKGRVAASREIDRSPT